MDEIARSWAGWRKEPLSLNQWVQGSPGTLVLARASLWSAAPDIAER